MKENYCSITMKGNHFQYWWNMFTLCVSVNIFYDVGDESLWIFHIKRRIRLKDSWNCLGIFPDNVYRVLFCGVVYYMAYWEHKMNDRAGMSKGRKMKYRLFFTLHEVRTNWNEKYAYAKFPNPFSEILYVSHHVLFMCCRYNYYWQI
jgi:hypothetical protein